MDKTALRLIGAAVAAALAFAATSMSQIPRLAIGIVVGLASFMMIIVGRRPWQGILGEAEGEGAGHNGSLLKNPTSDVCFP